MLRRLWLPVLLLLAVLGGLLVLGLHGVGVRASNLDPRLPAEPSVDARMSLQSSAVYSYSTFLPLLASKTPVENHIGVQYYGGLTADRGLNLHAEAGAKWIRYPLAWRWVEPENTTPDNFWWGGVDATIQRAADEGIELLVTIRGQPEWAAKHNMGPVYDFDELAEFVTALVERYDGDGYLDAPISATVQYFELYNEPDITTYWVQGAAPWGHRGDEYGALLAQLYPVVKAANPEAKFVVGGLAADWFIDQGGPFDREFTDDLLGACQNKDCFDVWNFH
ncbi:MAG: cellulase family glycosylhydrolase, partial [Anaerolineae bacterium]